jgi:hypothetical protein
MVRVKFIADEENYEFDVPESWEEITVKEFTKIMELADNKDNLSEIEFFVKVINVLTGIPEEIIYVTPIDKFNQISQLLNFIDKEIKGELKESIIVDGEEYFLKTQFDDLTMGEVISIEMLVEKYGNVNKCLDQLLCIFLRKKKENGKLESFKVSHMERAQQFEKVSITDIYQLMVFFSDGRTLSINSTKDSLEKGQKRKRKAGSMTSMDQQK